MTSQVYRHWATADLLREREAVSWDMAELSTVSGAWAFPEESLAYLVMRKAELDAEISRRERLRDAPGAPGWPRGMRDQRPDWAALKARVDLLAFVEYHAAPKLRKFGKQFIGPCPFPDHEDSSPSFVLNPGKQVWYCHGCKRGGDVFTFAQMYLSHEKFGDAAKAIRSWLGELEGSPSQNTIPDPTIPKPIPSSLGIVFGNSPRPVSFQNGKVVAR